MSSSVFGMMWAKAPIYMRKGVAALAPETNQKWLERTREGGPCVLRQFSWRVDCYGMQPPGILSPLNVEIDRRCFHYVNTVLGHVLTINGHIRLKYNMVFERFLRQRSSLWRCVRLKSWTTVHSAAWVWRRNTKRRLIRGWIGYSSNNAGKTYISQNSIISGVGTSIRVNVREPVTFSLPNRRHRSPTSTSVIHIFIAMKPTNEPTYLTIQDVKFMVSMVRKRTDN